MLAESTKPLGTVSHVLVGPSSEDGPDVSKMCSGRIVLQKSFDLLIDRARLALKRCLATVPKHSLAAIVGHRLLLLDGSNIDGCNL